MAADANQEGNDPSMEEVLQTIRDVIAGEPVDGGEGEGNESAEPAEEDILELTEMVNEDGSVVNVEGEASPPAEAGDILDNIDEAIASEEEPEPEPEPDAEPESDISMDESQPVEDDIADAEEEEDEPILEADPSHAQPPEEPETPDSLITEETVTESSKAIQSLVDATQKPKEAGMHFRSGETLENLVVESLKPELSAWLNENLPGLVKQLVEKEIKKLLPRDES